MGSLSPSPGDLPNPGIEPRSPSLQEDSLPAETQEKTKNIRVGSLSLLQWMFPSQESNWGLLHHRRILHQLSYQGSPREFNMFPTTLNKVVTVIILIIHYCLLFFVFFFLIEEKREQNFSRHSAWVSALTRTQKVWLHVSYFFPMAPS